MSTAPTFLFSKSTPLPPSSSSSLSTSTVHPILHHMLDPLCKSIKSVGRAPHILITWASRDVFACLQTRVSMFLNWAHIMRHMWMYPIIIIGPTPWLLISKLNWCDPGVWKCQLKTCWGCYCCWCWCWETCWRQFGADFHAEVWSVFCWCLVEVMKLMEILKLGLVNTLKFKFSKNANVYSRFWIWYLVEIQKTKFDQYLCLHCLQRTLWNQFVDFRKGLKAQ